MNLLKSKILPAIMTNYFAKNTCTSDRAELQYNASLGEDGLSHDAIDWDSRPDPYFSMASQIV